MAVSTTSRLIKAPRRDVYHIIEDIHTLATCLQPHNTTSRILDFDADSQTLRMEITHAPGADGTRRFHLTKTEAHPNKAVVYSSEFETEDDTLAGEMKLHFLLEDAPGGTEVTVRHEGLPERISVEDNEAGTQSSLENVARLLENRVI
jgi:uncharacterized protein YndB with AHSA1/START domain